MKNVLIDCEICINCIDGVGPWNIVHWNDTGCNCYLPTVYKQTYGYLADLELFKSLLPVFSY